MKKAVIVGCNGQDGRLMYDLLVQKDYGIIGIDRNFVRTNIPYDAGNIDITEAEEVFRLIDAFRPDEMYHLAAYHHSSEDSLVDELDLVRKSYEVNLYSLVNILEGVKRFSPTTKLFYASSSLIFGDSEDDMQDEQTPLHPNSIYGITKADGLLICRYYREKYGIFASVGILYNHESHLRQEKFLSKKIIRGAVDIYLNRRCSLVLGNLMSEVDWGYASDYVDAMHRIVALDASDEFIIATGKRHSVLDFVKIAFRYLDLDWEKYVEIDDSLIKRKMRPLVGNHSKIYQKTGWTPSVSFEHMVKLLIDEELEKYGDRKA